MEREELYRRVSERAIVNVLEELDEHDIETDGIEVEIKIKDHNESIETSMQG